MRGMDVEKSSQAPFAFRQSCRAALLTVLVVLSPVALFGLLFDRTIRMAAGSVLSAFAILQLVRWLNRRDSPRKVDHPGRNPDGTLDSH